jgi:hypothetical protein
MTDRKDAEVARLKDELDTARRQQATFREDVMAAVRAKVMCVRVPVSHFEEPNRAVFADLNMRALREAILEALT